MLALPYVYTLGMLIGGKLLSKVLSEPAMMQLGFASSMFSTLLIALAPNTLTFFFGKLCIGEILNKICVSYKICSSCVGFFFFFFLICNRVKLMGKTLISAKNICRTSKNAC